MNQTGGVDQERSQSVEERWWGGKTEVEFGGTTGEISNDCSSFGGNKCSCSMIPRLQAAFVISVYPTACD